MKIILLLLFTTFYIVKNMMLRSQNKSEMKYEFNLPLSFVKFTENIFSSNFEADPILNKSLTNPNKSSVLDLNIPLMLEKKSTILNNAKKNKEQEFNFMPIKLLEQTRAFDI